MELVHFIPTSQRRTALAAAQAEGAPVLICGSSGTGKGSIAKWIHQNSARSSRLFLVAQQGHDLAPQIREAQSGTLMIPEIGEWSLTDQKILLEYFRTRSIPHPDANGTRMLVNARIIATSSQSLVKRTQSGLFKSELYEVLCDFLIEMPKLAERKDEFEDIVLGILREITSEIHKEYIQGISEDALKVLSDYHWPGNIRELRNVLRVATLQCKDQKLGLSDFPDFQNERVDFRATRDQFEKIYLEELLKASDWQLDRTCLNSRIDRDALLTKIKKYGIEIPAGSLSP